MPADQKNLARSLLSALNKAIIPRGIVASTSSPPWPGANSTAAVPVTIHTGSHLDGDKRKLASQITHRAAVITISISEIPLAKGISKNATNAGNMPIDLAISG